MTSDALVDSLADSELLDALVQSAFDVIGIVSQVATAHELSLTQLRVLAILRDRRPTMSELADYLGLDRSTITGLIDRASGRGLLERVANDADKRSARIALTEQGRLLAAEGAREITAGVAPLLSALSPAERSRLTGLLRRMVPVTSG